MRQRTRSGLTKLGALAGAAVLLLAACGDDDDDGDAAEGEGDVSIALLLPETKTARYEDFDRPFFEAKAKEVCNAEIVYSNANQDAAEQQGQAEAALTQGVDVMVLDPVDSDAAAAVVGQANGQGVPVISYDRLIKDSDVDYYISFDNEKVGELQGTALVEELEANGQGSGTIVMINGSPTDNNATLFKKGAHSVIDASDVTVGAEFDTPDWSPDEAQREMDQALTSLGAENIVGVYAANDGTAGGAVAAMKGAGVDPIPPLTGQDAELAAIQRIVAGEQFMTVYKAIQPEAEAAAELACAIAVGDDPPEGLVNATVDNGQKDVDSVLLEPVSVTVDNIEDTVVADDFWSVEDICSAEFEEACEAAGLT